MLSRTASIDDVVVEYVDHLHEHFVDPVQMKDGRYVALSRPGYSAQIRRETLERHGFPEGEVWRELLAKSAP